MALWVVRAGRHGEQEAVALEKGVVCHGWNELPDYSACQSREALKALYKKMLPMERDKQVFSGAGQTWRFAHDIKRGDLVALPLKAQAAIALGRVTGDYEYRELAPNVRHTRKVKWIKTIPRAAFDQDILNIFGSTLTVFQAERNDAEARVEAMLSKESTEAPQPLAHPIETQEPSLDIEGAASDQLLGFIAQHFHGHDMARLVDAILRAQGYRTKVSPPGPDGGVDILAGKGLLGFDEPRLCVQVKATQAAADQKTFNELLGVMSKYKTQQGLFVSWSGYTKAVLQDAKKEHFSIRLWDQGDLVDAILAYYEHLDEEIRAELPLKRIWVLVRDEEG